MDEFTFAFFIGFENGIEGMPDKIRGAYEDIKSFKASEKEVKVKISKNKKIGIYQKIYRNMSSMDWNPLNSVSQLRKHNLKDPAPQR